MQQNTDYDTIPQNNRLDEFYIVKFLYIWEGKNNTRYGYLPLLVCIAYLYDTYKLVTSKAKKDTAN